MLECLGYVRATYIASMDRVEGVWEGWKEETLVWDTGWLVFEEFDLAIEGSEGHTDCILWNLDSSGSDSPHSPRYLLALVFSFLIPAVFLLAPPVTIGKETKICLCWIDRLVDLLSSSRDLGIFCPCCRDTTTTSFSLHTRAFIYEIIVSHGIKPPQSYYFGRVIEPLWSGHTSMDTIEPWAAWAAYISTLSNLQDPLIYWWLWAVILSFFFRVSLSPWDAPSQPPPPSSEYEYWALPKEASSRPLDTSGQIPPCYLVVFGLDCISLIFSLSILSVHTEYRAKGRSSVGHFHDFAVLGGGGEGGFGGHQVLDAGG